MNARKETMKNTETQPRHSQQQFIRRLAETFEQRAATWEREQGEVGAIVASELRTLNNIWCESHQPAAMDIYCNNAEMHWLTDGKDLVCYVYGRHSEPALFLWSDGARWGFELNLPYARALDGYEQYLRDGWKPCVPNSDSATHATEND